MSSFLEAQFGIGVESTVGTRVAPTRFYPFLSESLAYKLDTYESQSYRTGRTTKQNLVQGAYRTLGDVAMELAPQGLGLLLKHAFGAVVTAGAGPYTHTLTPGDLVGKGLSVQVGRTAQDGTMVPFDFAGCKITKLKLDAKVGSIPQLVASLYGITQVDTGQTLATPTYPSGLVPFTWQEASLTIAGTAVPVLDASINFDNGLKVDRHRMQATNPGQSLEPIGASVRDYSGTLTADFTSDLTLYNLFVNQTQATLVLTFNHASNAKLVCTHKVKFNDSTPQASGIGNETSLPLPFVGVDPTSDANVATWVLTNGDSAP